MHAASPALPLLLLATLCALVMGFAIQRGATCMVAAVDELVRSRKAGRMLALIEASAVVTGGLAVAKLLGRLPVEPAAFPPTAATVAGGVLLGIGAFVAGSCMFGAIARIGSGERAYWLVPAGFFLGCWVMGRVEVGAAPMSMLGMSPVLVVAGWLMLPLAVLALWRAGRAIQSARTRSLGAYVASYHVATVVIGLIFVVLMLAVGPWSYTDYLAKAAQGMADGTSWRGLLFVALLGGACLGGRHLRGRHPDLPAGKRAARCLAGGALMGTGSMLVPGSNDGLVLVNAPLAHSFALVALATMAATIVVIALVQARWPARRASP